MSSANRVPLDVLTELLAESDARTLRQFLSSTFYGLGSDAADAIIKEAGIGPRTSPGKLKAAEIARLHEAMKSVTAKPGVDRVFAGEGVLYYSRLISKASQSQLSRVVGKPAYKNMTIRNWNTTSKLLQLMEAIRNRSI
jgi:ribosomal protein S13